MSSDKKQFKKELLKALEESSTESIPKTTIIKDVPELGTSTEDFLKAKEIVKKKLPEVPVSLKYNKLPDISESLDFDPEGTASLHKTANQVSKEVVYFAAKERGKSKVFSKLSKLLEGKLGKVLKYGVPPAAVLGIASDILASEDIDSEQSELEAIKKEKEFEKIPEDIKIKSKELLQKPINAQELLQQIVKPTISEVGGQPDIRPEKAKEMLGQQISDDKNTEEILNRDNYEKMLKKRLGY